MDPCPLKIIDARLLFVLTLASDRAVLYGKIAYSILVLLTIKRYSTFLKRVCVFQKICFKIEVLKTFKISIDDYIKTCRSLKRRAFSKILKWFFRRPYALSVGFKMKPLRKIIFLCWDKNQLKFCRKPCWNAERSNHSFVSIWWITFFRHLYSLIRHEKFKEINRLYKHRKRVRSSQASISINSCTELSKTQFSLLVNC